MLFSTQAGTFLAEPNVQISTIKSQLDFSGLFYNKPKKAGSHWLPALCKC
ncbi:hypothetical protein KUC_0672 [Vreelandella boliviensis LC1]|uniref:Uncharacterized protein n=1 Tax=Vreelandella boliviensis LC1 TaxID=1072583 RepID=A0A7U9GG63_9GAMM|nr:hypothetical protein KUC_0672 [Halomonas boliviensis LC1]